MHDNADTLSRFLLRGEEVPDNDTSVLHQLHCEELYITAKAIANSIKKNPLLSKVSRYVKSGWPSTVEEQVRSYDLHNDELTVEQGCLLRGMQITVPPEKRKRILSPLHETHPGIVRMKTLGRSYVKWALRLMKTWKVLLKHAGSVNTITRKTPSPTRAAHQTIAKDSFRLCRPFQRSGVARGYSMTTITSLKTIQELRWIFASPEQY